MTTVRKEEEIEFDANILAGLTDNIVNLKLPNVKLRDYYRDEAERILWIDDTIDASALDISKQILYYNKLDKNIPVEERKPIKIFIDTGGGAVSVMWQIIQTIKLSKTPVWTINWCDAMSAGAHILAAGHKRFGMPGSTVLLHSGSCSFSGTQEQADSAKKYYDVVGKQAETYLLETTKIDPKLYKKKSPFDWYLTAEEALQYNIIDEIIDDLDKIN